MNILDKVNNWASGLKIEYFFIIAILLLFIALVGVILDWDWIVARPISRKYAWIWENFSRTVVRIILGTFIIILMFALLFLIFTYRFN